MRTLRILCAVLLLSLGVQAKTPKECANRIPASWTGAAREAALADCEFYTQSVERGAAAWADFADENVVTAWARGRNEVQKVMEKSYADSSFALNWYPTQAYEAGPFVVTSGTYLREMNGKAAGTGTYITVWKRSSDGKWRYIFDGGEAAKKQ